jgi:adenylate cyclase class IV
MRNIELKVRIADLAAAEATARSLGASGPTRLRQVDSYFACPRGRLKLREISGDETRAELIFYLRDDLGGTRPSDYRIVPTGDPAGLKDTLVAALGLKNVVDKRRTLYLLGNLRIHLDQVAGLGDFLEFEAVLDPESSDQAGDTLVRELAARFGIDPDRGIAGSYTELLAAASADPPQ